MRSSASPWLAMMVVKDNSLQICKSVTIYIQNAFSFHLCVIPVANNPGDTRFFGKSFRALPAMQLPFLQYVHECSQSKVPVVLELAAAQGMVSWKVPYAFENGGKVYVNDLSAPALEFFKKIIPHRIIPELRDSVTVVPGDCFELPRQYPELVGVVDVLYVQNLEHFFNPVQHQEFLALVNSLLAPNGRAFLLAHTLIPSTANKNHPIYQNYIAQKIQSVHYPAFHRIIGTAIMIDKSNAMIGDPTITEASRPDDSTHCGRQILQVQDLGKINTPYGMQSCSQLTQDTVENLFTPAIYRAAIAQHPTLEVLDAYFINQNGEKRATYTSDETNMFAGVILQKKIPVEPNSTPNVPVEPNSTPND